MSIQLASSMSLTVSGASSLRDAAPKRGLAPSARLTLAMVVWCLRRAFFCELASHAPKFSATVRSAPQPLTTSRALTGTADTGGVQRATGPAVRAEGGSRVGGAGARTQLVLLVRHQLPRAARGLEPADDLGARAQVGDLQHELGAQGLVLCERDAHRRLLRRLHLRAAAEARLLELRELGGRRADGLVRLLHLRLDLVLCLRQPRVEEALHAPPRDLLESRGARCRQEGLRSQRLAAQVACIDAVVQLCIRVDAAGGYCLRVCLLAATLRTPS